jgi:C4-type Zn-finger protein
MKTKRPKPIADEGAQPLRYVFITKPRCPVCGSPCLKTVRSTTERTEAVVSRWTHCLSCSHRFFVVVE